MTSSIRNMIVVLFACILAVVGVVMATPEPAQANHGPLGWVAKCTYAKRGSFDPIKEATSHTHEFFGAEDITQTSNPSDLRSMPTTCDVPQDRAGYWLPVHKEVVNGNTVTYTPDNVHAYYRKSRAEATDNNSVLFPQDLEVIIGDATSTGPQPHVFYQCTGSGANEGVIQSDVPINCFSSSPGSNNGADLYPTAVVEGPDCYITSAAAAADPDITDNRAKHLTDYQSHTAYSSNGSCPNNYTPGVRVNLHFRYPQGTNFAGSFLSSGDAYTLHGDFMDGWNRAALDRLNTQCIRDGGGCNSAETIAAASP